MNYIKRLKIPAILLFGLMLAASCNSDNTKSSNGASKTSTSASKKGKTIPEQRTEIMKQLDGWSDDFDREVTRLEKAINSTNGEDKVKLETQLKGIKKLRTRLSRQMKKVKTNKADDWKKTKTEALRTLKNVQIEYKKLYRQ